MRIFLSSILIATFLISCNPDSKKEASKGRFYGAEFDTTKAIAFDQAVAKFKQSQLQDFDIEDSKVKGMNVVLKNTVSSVCQGQGCWMKYNTSSNSDSVRITFKDYAFFVPIHIQGQESFTSGIMYLDSTGVDELRVIASEEGASEADIQAINKPVFEYKLYADGVFVSDTTKHQPN